jgi:hypothetical protein
MTSSQSTHKDSLPRSAKQDATQVVDRYAEDVDTTMAAIDAAIRNSLFLPKLCPYHETLVRQEGNPAAVMTSMSRFLMGKHEGESAIYYDESTGHLTITKPCTCSAFVHSGSTVMHRVGPRTAE